MQRGGQGVRVLVLHALEVRLAEQLLGLRAALALAPPAVPAPETERGRNRGPKKVEWSL